MKVVSTIDTAHPAYVRICVEDGEKVQELKNITMDDYVQLVNGSVATQKKMERIGKLPDGFYDGGYDVLTGTYEAIIHVPGGKRPIFFMEQAHVVAFPSLVFYLRTDRNRMTKSLLFAVDDSKGLSEQSKLYHYPYGNVYKDGRICWGRNELPKISSFADFGGVINLFFGSPTNNDLYEPPEIKQEGKEFKPSQQELIGFAEKEDFFPEKFLKSAGGKLGEL